MWKTMSKKWEDKPQTGRKYLQKTYLIKRLLSKIAKELLRLKNRITDYIKKKNHLTLQEVILMANKHIKRCTKSKVIRKMQLKTMRCHCTPIWMAKFQNIGNTKFWQECGMIGIHSLLVGMQNSTATLWDSLVISCKTKHTFTIWTSNHAAWYLLRLRRNQDVGK